MRLVREHFLATQTIIVALGILVSALVVSNVINASVHRAELRACHRLNVVRASQNRTNRNAFEFDSLEAALVEASVKKQTGSVPRTEEQKKQTEAFIAKLNEITADLDWIKLTDCHAAVFSDKYHAPDAVKFSEAMPPAAVYTVGKGQ